MKIPHAEHHLTPASIRLQRHQVFFGFFVILILNIVGAAPVQTIYIPFPPRHSGTRPAIFFHPSVGWLVG